MSFCPVCGAHHDPQMPCADRAGELLRDAGIEPAPLDRKELKETVKKANRSLVVLLFGVLALFILIILLSYVGSFRISRQAARADIESGAAWLDKGERDKAITDFTEAIASKQLSTKELAFAHYNRGRALYDKENYDKAIEDFGEAISLDPFSIPYYARGLAWLQKGDYDKAITDFNEAIRIHPQYADVYMSRGISRFNKGEFSSAALDLEKSQQFNSDIYTAIWLYLARAHDNRDGKNELSVNTRGTDTKKWPAAVVALFLDKAVPNAVISQAEDPDPKVQKGQLCDANFFLGEWHLLRNGKQQARTLFTKAQNDCPRHSFEYKGAVFELQRLK